jgi:hypothetical protein
MWTCRLYSSSPPAVLTCRAVIILVRTPTGIPRYLRYAASASQITQPLSFMSNQRKNLLRNKQLNFQPYNSKVVGLVRLAGRFCRRISHIYFTTWLKRKKNGILKIQFS